MHKHEGIVVVAYKPGQARSQVEADLALAELGDEFLTAVSHVDGHEGLAAKVNRIDEASQLIDELQDAGFDACALMRPTTGWALV
ncbi:hypothetical protein D3C77_34430 [compost metagenome]